MTIMVNVNVPAVSAEVPFKELLAAITENRDFNDLYKILDAANYAIREVMYNRRFDLAESGHVQDLNAMARDAINLAQNMLSVYKSAGVNSTELTSDEKQLCKEGHPIRAIKSVRDRLNIGVKEAKDIVDAYRAKAGV